MEMTAISAQAKTAFSDISMTCSISGHIIWFAKIKILPVNCVVVCYGVNSEAPGSAQKPPKTRKDIPTVQFPQICLVNTIDD